MDTNVTQWVVEGTQVEEPQEDTLEAEAGLPLGPMVEKSAERLSFQRAGTSEVCSRVKKKWQKRFCSKGESGSQTAE